MISNQKSKTGFTLIRTLLRKHLVNGNAFTLIELLVVISIIGVLSTLLFANFVGVRERGRDATRKSDISQIQKALELYKNAQTPPSYPATASLSLIAPNYMKVLPHDPLCSGSCTINTYPDYRYRLNPAGDGNLTYDLVACLDNASDQQKDGTKVIPYCADSKASYTRTEP